MASRARVMDRSRGRARWGGAGGIWTWPRAIGGAVTALSVVFALSVAAQPRHGGPTAAKGADAGASRTTAAGSASAAAATPPSVASDAGAPSASGSADAAASLTAPPASATAPSTPLPTYHPHEVTPLPPPTPEQVSAYQAMSEEADAFQKGAHDYKDTITTIITLHYQEKKKAILGGLDREIGIEKDELKKARETAIKRLEDFVAKYSGPNAQPEETPDAMFRLAALYEERARSDDDPNANLGLELEPAIALYKRVVHEFPKYARLAGIYYYLGHALNDANRSNEAQQVWRSLVCHNHYPYPVATDPKNPDVDTIGPMPQDHDEAYWKAWRMKYYRPEALKKGPKADTTFDDPYPSDCASISQPDVLPGEKPKYVAEIWWRIGDWEFDQDDMGGGVVTDEPSAVWDYNRAASAYQHAMKIDRKSVIYGVALYKYAWTLFKQQRYEQAVHEFVHLLNYTDERQKETGDPGADFRSEAYTYIAGSLDNYDFTGPGPDDPFIARPDILDTAKSPAEAEQKLHVAIDRVQDPRLIPQDKPWTIEIYRALALEFRAINQYKNALAVYQLTLDKWPMDPSAPETQNAIAEVYELLVRQTKIGDERRQYEAKVLDAQTALAKYIGDTPWVDANKDDPEALQKAEELVRTGLKGAAITHTKNAQAAVEAEGQTSDGKEQLRLTNYALQEYKLAAIGWLGYLKQDENAPDAYKSRYFYADALHSQVRLEVVLHKVDAQQYPPPSSDEIAKAMQAAVDVRDSDEDDAFIENAGNFVVDLADVDRDLAFQQYKDTGGTQGIEERTQPKLEGPDGSKTVVAEDIPPVIQKSMQARDEYIERVPPERDTEHNANDYAFYTADQYFLYGHFKQAQDRMQAIYEQHCGKDPTGYEAWKVLITMSNLQNDAARSRQLAEAEQKHSCAVTANQQTEEKSGVLTTAVLQNAAFEDANKVFDEAQKRACINQDPSCKPQPGPELDALWKKCGSMYETALRAAPGHKDAPAAAIDSAFCYKQIGQFDKAIELYNLFISNYGSEQNLDRLQHGGTDPQTKAKVGPDPAQYKERIKYLGMAYDALSTTYYGFFAYQRAAESFGKIASNPRFDDQRRANAARIAMVLYSNLGDRSNMNKMYGIMVDPSTHLPADKRAEADYLRASFDYGQWNPNGGESAGNAAARRQAVAALSSFHQANRNRAESARYELEAAYRVAKMMEAANDPAYRTWLKTTIADWEYFSSHPLTTTGPDGKNVSIQATDAPYSDYGGEAAFTLVDEQVHEKFDYSTGHHHYQGNVKDVIAAVDKDLGEAEKTWRPQLDEIAQKYKSFEWAAASIARAGTLYDSIRTGLDLVIPKYFTPQQQALLNKLQKIADQLNAAGQADKADQVQQQIDATQDAVRSKWRETKDKYLEVCNQKMVSRYVTSALEARKYNVKDATVQGAVARLAFFTDYLGNDKMKAYVEQTPDPLNPGSNLTYVDGEFLQWRSGVDEAPPPSGEPDPLPAAP